MPTKDINVVSTQLHALLDKCKSENRAMRPDERQTWDRMIDEHDEIEASEARASQRSNGMGSVAEMRDTFRISQSQKRERERDPYARAFYSYLKNGDRTSLVESQVLHNRTKPILNTMSTAAGSQGGFLIPQDFSDMLEEAQLWFGSIENSVEVFYTATGAPMPWPTTNDTNNMGRMLMDNQQVVQQDPTFGAQTFNAFIGSSDIVIIPLALMQDSYFDMPKLLAKMLGIRLGRLLNNKCSVGSGVNEPQGIIPASIAAGNVLTLGPGNTTTIGYSNLVDLQHLVDPDYRDVPSARWMFSDSVLKTLKKLQDSAGRPLWQPALSATFQTGAGVIIRNTATILDSPYTINKDMATIGANAYSMLFGDLSKYKLRKVAGGTTVVRLNERYGDLLQVGFMVYQRFDGQLLDAGTHPVAVMRQSAT